MFSLLSSILVPIFIGFLFVCLLWPDQRTGRSCLLLKGCLAVGLGFGISSCIFFLWLLISSLSSNGFVMTEIALLISLIVIYLYAIKSRNYSICSEFHSESVPKLKIHRILSIGFYLTLASTIVASIFLSLNRPHGVWDAWAVWNMRARFIFRGGAQWRDVFSPLMDPPGLDHPLLISGSIARCWKYMGHETQAIPALLAMLFTLATVGLTFSSLSILRSKSQGFLAGLVLLGTPFFITHGASQQADVPLGFFFLAIIVLFSLQDRLAKNNYSLLFLAGMTAGFAAWTKNEGFLFLVSIIIARFALIVPLKGWKTYLREILFFTMGLIPILIIIIYFKTQLAPPCVSYLYLFQVSPLTINRLLDLSRYLLILKAFVIQTIYFGNCVVYIIPLLAFYLLLLGIKVVGKDKVGIATSLIALYLMLTGYFFIYLTSPHNLDWHLSTSLHRLFLQLWPSFIFTYFLIVSTPEQAVMRKKNSRGSSQRLGKYQKV